MEVDHENIRALKEAQPPTKKSELRSLVGLANVYRRFIDEFNNIAAPLNSLLKKGQPDSFGDLNELQTSAFDTLVHKVITPPILAFPIPGLPYSIDTDASVYKVGCALFQQHHNGERKPIGYWSRSLNQAENNYSTTERECLALVWGIQTLRPYLEYKWFTVYTDHAAFRWLLTIADPSGRLTRWRLRLSEFDFVVVYKTGKINTQAEAMSRLTTKGDHTGRPGLLTCFQSQRGVGRRQHRPRRLSRRRRLRPNPDPVGHTHVPNHHPQRSGDGATVRRIMNRDKTTVQRRGYMRINHRR